MNEKENDIIYTATDIEKYLSGKLSPLQMHAMEKAALDDPFLAEAMEGYTGMDNEEWKVELAALKDTFAENDNPAKVIPFSTPKRRNTWWKAAAAVLLIGSTAAISYILINKKDKQEIAKNIPVENNNTAVIENKQTTVDTNRSASPSTETATATVPEVKTATKSTGRSATNSTAANSEPAVASVPAESNTLASADIKIPDSQFVYRPAKEKAKPFSKMNESVAINDPGLVVNRSKAATASLPPSAQYNNVLERKAEENAALRNTNSQLNYAYQFDKAKAGADKDGMTTFKKEAELNRNFIAQVVGPDNSPLPFANISIKNENFGTYADAKGNFRLVSSDSVLTVEVKAAGYQPKFYTLQSYAQQNKIMLNEDNTSLQYKAISGNSTASAKTRSRRATLVKDSLINVEPADGWDNYNTYVDNNLDIPDDILQKNIHGKVELSFDVRSNGTITNIKVDKSLCDNCDEVAKRLIEQGPQWKVKKGKKGKGKVTVEF